MLWANWICSYVLNDMLAIHQNGTSTTRQKPTRPAVVAAFQAVMPSCRPLAQQVAAEQRDQRDQQRDHEDRDRDAAPPAELVERDLVGVRREDLGGGAGAASGHHVDDVEVVDGEDEG